MTARKIILDCDPGHDDAVAILLALGDPAIELLGITTVGGNQTLEKVAHNARVVCTVAGVTDVPVYAGCTRPLARIFHWWGLLLVVGLGLWVVVWWGWLGPGRGVRPGAPFGGWWLF